MFEDLIGIPRELWPEADELPGELPFMAKTIEAHSPGMGVEITLMMATLFGKQPLYVHAIDKLKRDIRNEAIRADSDKGMSPRQLAVKYKLSKRQIETIIYSSPSQNEMKNKQQSLW